MGIKNIPYIKHINKSRCIFMCKLIEKLSRIPFWALIGICTFSGIFIFEASTVAFTYYSQGEFFFAQSARQLVSSALASFALASIAVTLLHDLKKSEEQIAYALHGTNDGLWDWNLESNHVYYSPLWKSMLGYEATELPNHLSTWEKIVHPDDKDNVLTSIQQYIDGETSSFEVDMRMLHKKGHYIYVLSRAFLVVDEKTQKPKRIVGTHTDITARKKDESFRENASNILKMIAIGRPATEIYDAIALMYEERHIGTGMRCSMLELDKTTLLHGGAPSLPKEYCDAVHGLQYGPNIGSCGTSTYTGKTCIVENIETDPKWKDLKAVALPFGLRSCWSEPIINSSGKVLGALGMYHDYPTAPDEHELNDLKSAAHLTSIVMERDQAQKRIHQLAYHDELTGLANRPHIHQIIEDKIKLSNINQQQFTIFYIDLDNFKDVNDSLGHEAGDLLLKEIAQRLKQTQTSASLVGRLSGDEFCLIFDHSDAELSAIAELALSTISEPFDIAFSSRKLIPSCSIGIAKYPDDAEDMQSLIKAADTSLYYAKEKGKNQYAFYDRSLSQNAEYRFQFEQCLREAIENKEITVQYQPQIDIQSGEIIAVEALSRWHHEQLGPVSPCEFIPIAEKINMIKPLTEWVLNTACQQVMAWEKAGSRPIKVAINVSPSHFLDHNIIDSIKRVLEETGIPPTQLKLEVTENITQTDLENLTIFQQLKQLGIQLAIDDFGTGYSSFSSLKHLNVDYLKIDKYFIDEITTDTKTKSLVESMIEMGHSLEYKIIAEGIETKEQLALVQKLNCDIIQGHLFSKSVDADQIPALLEKQFTY